eukprot:40097-Eustigmatos_ZCMA.PRE.1
MCHPTEGADALLCSYLRRADTCCARAHSSVLSLTTHCCTNRLTAAACPGGVNGGVAGGVDGGGVDGMESHHHTDQLTQRGP